MGVKYCPDCNEQVKDTAKFCPECGYDFRNKQGANSDPGRTMVNPNKQSIRNDYDGATMINTGNRNNGYSSVKEGTILAGYRIGRQINDNSGEADLYLCTKDDKTYVAKIYRRVDGIKKDVLKKIKGINSPYIAKIYDSGLIGDYTFEILQYFEKGSLEGKSFSYKFIHDTIVPNLNEALKTLHKKGIVHKDIKPSNVMLSDDGKSVVLIDFGISSIMEEDVNVRVTSIAMTLDYAAPEAKNGTILRESDYYSLGILLYEAFTGHVPYANLDKMTRVRYSALQKIPYPDNMNPELKDLITGLTYFDIGNRNDPNNPNRRWTYKEVEDWCNGNIHNIPGESKRAKISGYSFCGKEYESVHDIAEAFLANWDKGKKDLFRGKLTGYLMAFDPEASQCCTEAEENSEEGSNEDLEFMRAMYRIAPKLDKIYWKKLQRKSLKDFGKEILENLRDGNTRLFREWNELIQNKVISCYLSTRDCSQELLDAVDAIEQEIKTLEDRRKVILNYYYLGYLLSGDRTLVIEDKVFESYKELADYLNMLYRKSFGAFYLFIREISLDENTLDPQTEAWLRAIRK